MNFEGFLFSSKLGLPWFIPLRHLDLYYNPISSASHVNGSHPHNMDFQDIGEEFLVEDVETTIKSAIGSVLNDTMYTSKKVNDWSNNILSNALKGLQSLNRPFKYVLTVIIMQKNGAGLTTAASTYWDAAKDGLCKVTWENNSMHCIVTVYGLAVNIDTPDEMD